MKAYKGFNKDMTCRGFQFKEGETYHEDKAELCESGFHACEDPIDCLSYYDPANSEYHEVELEEVCKEKKIDSKICGKTIKIGAKLSIADICKVHFEYVKSKTIKKNDKNVQGNRSAASVQGDMSAASVQGDMSAASVQGNWSAASAQGYGSAASVQGDMSAASVQGDMSAASVQGNRSAASAQGYGSAASVQGDMSAASVQGYGSAGISTGTESRVDSSAGSISIGWGKDNICKGEIGSYIVLVERGEWDGEKYPQIGEPKLGKVDGITLKADTWYKLVNGEFVEVSDNDK